jgi:hypothetical protein
MRAVLLALLTGPLSLFRSRHAASTAITNASPREAAPLQVGKSIARSQAGGDVVERAVAKPALKSMKFLKRLRANEVLDVQAHF